MENVCGLDIAYCEQFVWVPGLGMFHSAASLSKLNVNNQSIMDLPVIQLPPTLDKQKEVRFMQY